MAVVVLEGFEKVRVASARHADTSYPSNRHRAPGLLMMDRNTKQGALRSES